MPKRLALAARVTLLCLAAPAAHALLDVDGSSLAGALPAGRTAPTYTVRWTLTKSDITGPVFSTEGVFVGQPGQVFLGTLPTALVDPSPSASSSVLTERVRLPASVIDAAQSRGLAIAYTRTFEDLSPQNGTGSVAIAPTGSLAGPFQLLRVQLELDTEGSEPLAVVTPGSALRARARVAYAGSGVLEAVWEVADASSVGGTPLFRPLRRVRRFLDSAGRIELRSPELPSSESGLHLARLRVLRPESAFAPRPVRYSVAAQPGDPPPPAELRVESPPPAVFLDAGTPFRWSPVAGARAYRLELFAHPGAPPGPLPEDSMDPPTGEMSPQPPPRPGRRLTGVLLRPGDRSVSLPSLSLARLPPGQRILWRVRALGDGGVVIAESAPRELRVPLR